MIGRSAMGWQTMLADLSLILFMVTAAAMANDGPAPAPKAAAAVPPAASPSGAPPLAVWRAGPGAPRLEAWLARQAPDPRARLTITLRYPRGGAAEAWGRAEALVHAAGPSAANARLVVEPALAAPETLATLEYDAASP